MAVGVLQAGGLAGPGLTRPRPSQRALRAEATAAIVAAIAAAIAAGGTGVDCGGLRAELVVVNQPVAEAVAMRYRGRGVDAEDLVQVACEGLVKAAAKFDPAIRGDFLTYAVPTMRGEVRRYFRDLGWVVRPPRRVQELQWRAGQVWSDLAIELGHEPAQDDFLAELGVSAADYEEAMSIRGAFQPQSLDAPTSVDADSTLAKSLSVDAGLDEVETRHLLGRAFAVLTERERRVVYERYWLDRHQREIGEGLGITQTQVSRVLQGVRDKLRAEITGQTTGTAADAAETSPGALGA